MNDVFKTSASENQNNRWQNVVFNTGETQEDLHRKYNYEGSLLRKIQLRMLDMLLYLDCVCKEIGVSYRLDGGTVLGAVRHGGFIPWDDDVDVVIDDYNDYKRLCKYLIEHEHSQYKLQCHETDKGYYEFWNVLRDTKSEYIKNDRVFNVRKYKGLQIDIFPYEPGNILFLNTLSDKVAWLKYRTIGRADKIAELVYDFQKNKLHPCFYFFNKHFGNQEIYMHSYGTPWRYKIPKDVTLPYRPMEFEGHIFPGPAKPEGFLKILYGNWQLLTPENKRNHHRSTHRIWD